MTSASSAVFVCIRKVCLFTSCCYLNLEPLFGAHEVDYKLRSLFFRCVLRKYFPLIRIVPPPFLYRSDNRSSGPPPFHFGMLYLTKTEGCKKAYYVICKKCSYVM